MQFVLSEEQVLIQDTARKFFSAQRASAGVRAVMDSEAAYDDGRWNIAMSEMGFGGIALPAAYGGAGLGYVELAIIMMEMGRALYPSPFLSSICLAMPAIVNAASEAQKAQLLPPLASGKTIASLAYMSTSGQPDPEVMLTRSDGALYLSGCSGFVPYGHVADLLVIAARDTGGGVTLLALPAKTSGLSIERHETLDLTRPLSTLRFANVAVQPDQVLGSAGEGAAALNRTLDLARIALAAEQVGGAEAVLDMTVAYSKERTQFGRPIGSFQALKHRMADMMVVVETAKTAAYYSACIADEGSNELSEAAAIAKAYCSDAFLACVGQAIQLHGGIGFTWEHDAHLYFKRARGSATLFGDAASQREKVAQLIGLGEVA